MVDTYDSKILEEMILTFLRDKQPLSNKDFRDYLFPNMEKGNYAPELDRALQRLRKAGLIKPGPKGWTRAETKPCQNCKGRGFVS